MTPTDDGGSVTSSQPLRTVRGLNRSYKAPRRTIWVRTGIAILGILVVCGAAVGVLAHQVSEVRSQMEQAMSLAPQLRTDLADANYAGAQQTFNHMQHQISAARSITAGPLWKTASIIPVAGANFSAVAEVVVSADEVSTRAIAPLLGRYDSLNWEALSPADGRVDTTQLQVAGPDITNAANTVRLSYERMSAIDHSSLLPQIAAPIQSATDQLRLVSEALAGASAAGQLLPAMLGAEEPRNYLVLVQNSAETRATGGIPGALAVLNTHEGKLSMGEQGSAGALGTFKPAIDVDREQEALYTARLGTQMQNVNLTPDFPTAALTAKKMWEERHSGQTVDGVLALDPIVLGHLLKATGPVTLSDPAVLDLIDDTALPKSLTEENVVSTLLSDVYREIEEPAAQDLYFAAVAGQVFAAFTHGQGNSEQLIKAFTTSVQERRLYLWSSREDEQTIVATTALAGSTAGPQSGGAAFGVYMNDGTGAKMDYYASRTVQLLQTCQSDGYGSYTVQLNVSNTAPVDAGSSLPAYVTGDGVFGVDPGRLRTNYVFYGPVQAFVETATVNGERVPVGSGTHGQRPVGTVALELGPGESAEMELVFSHVVQDSEPRIYVTPTIESPDQMILPLKRTECG